MRRGLSESIHPRNRVLTSNATDLTTDPVRQALTGDVDAFQRVIPRWYGKIYAHCQAKLMSRADAEDATQETFLRGFAQLGQLNSPAAMGSWLRGIAHHVCVDVIRRNRVRQTTTTEGDLPDACDSTEEVEAHDEQDHLVELVNNLPSALRETVLLHYYEEMSYDEISVWLGVARSTVSERLRKARYQLKRELLPERCGDEV